MSAEASAPGQESYEQALSALFNGDAAASQPACIMQPRDRHDVAAVVEQARSTGAALSVRGGGHSRFCSADGAMMLDLSSHLNAVVVEGDRVHVQGGAGMGTVLHQLAPTGRMVPVGTHATTGFGLLMMGGIGHLSRSYGLTLDCIEVIRGVRADGGLFTLAAGHTDPDAWRLLRGAAPFLAVVTDVTMRTYPRCALTVIRQLLQLGSLQQALMTAEASPREVSCSFVLSAPPGQREPMAMRYCVAQSQDATHLSPELLEESPGRWRAQVEGLEQLPDFNLPNRDGSCPKDPPLSSDRFNRPQTWIYCISVTRGLLTRLVPLIVSALEKLPNPLCRIDFQHIGGAVQDRPMTSSVYRGREAEWSIVVTAVWSPGDADGETSARAWADGVFDALESFACHVYLVERHPEAHRYQRELDLAYGPDLEFLRRMKHAWDPDGILPPLESAALSNH